MEEKVLKRVAIITAIAGFLALFLITRLQPPEEVDSKSQLPEDTTIRFDARIKEVRETSHGSSIELQRTVRERGFIDTNVPAELVGAEATITGKVTDGFFSIERIEVDRKINGSSG